MAPMFDVIRALALVAGFAVSLTDRKTTMFADMVFSSWLGAGAILFPQFFIGQQVYSDKTANDPDSILMYRFLGVNLLVPMLMWYSCRKSRDDSVVGALLWSRTLGLFPFLMVSLYGHFSTKKTFTDRNMWFFILFIGCILVSNVVQLLKTRPSVGRREQKGAVSIVFRLEFLLFFIAALASMAFPQMTLSHFVAKPTTFQLYLERSMGALVFSQVFLIWFAPSFRDNEDRRRLFCMQLTILLVAGGCMACSFYSGTMRVEQLRVYLVSCVPFLLPATGLYLMSEGNQSSSSSKTYFTRSKSS